MAFILKDFSEKFYLIVNQMQIGSNPTNQLVLLDPQVLPFHAILWDQGNTLTFQDLSGGLNTLVNGTPIQGVITLQIGDQISIGGNVFRVASDSQVIQSPPQINNPVPQQNQKSPDSHSPRKSRPGCGRWILIALLVFLGECMLIGLFAVLFSFTDVEIAGGLQDLKGYISPDKSSLNNPPSDTSIPGPKIISLNDSWLTGNATQSFSQHVEDIASGISPEGVQTSSGFITDIDMEASPVWLSYTKSEQQLNGEIIQTTERAISSGKIYTGTDTCNIENDPENGNYSLDTTPESLLTSILKGHVKLVEQGVVIDGVITDRYQIRKDNFGKSDTIIEFEDGSLYRARDGGYLIQLDFRIKVKPQSWYENTGTLFSDTDPAEIIYHFKRSYSPENTMEQKLPKVCSGQ